MAERIRTGITGLDEIKGELKRSLIVWKTRGTSHSMRRHPFEMTDKGIIAYPDKILSVVM